MRYAVRFQLPSGLISWWSNAYDEDDLKYTTTMCLEQYPNAIIMVEQISEDTDE
jgi:hypothetical protein